MQSSLDYVQYTIIDLFLNLRMETVSYRLGIKLMKWITVLTVVLAIGLNATGVPRRITNPPLNAVAEVGGQAIFNCTSDTTQQNWVFTTNREEVEAGTGQSIVIVCVVQSGFTTHYEAVRPGGSNNSCNLIVKETTMQQAGVYTCTDSVPGTSAILTVIDRDATITVNSQPETVEGETVTMSYTVRYNTSIASSKTPTIQPVLTWTNSDGNAATGSPSETTNSVTSNISVTAGRQDVQPYTCHISFEIKWPSPSSGLSFASNTPNSTSNPPITPTINVLYTPIISSITTSQPICPDKTVINITCHATANPGPTYSWVGPDSRIYSGETIIAADMNGTYTCTASNVIRGSLRSDVKETTVNVSEDCTQDHQTTDKSNTVVIVCVVIGAYILGNITATVVFLIYYNRNIGFKLKLNDCFTWLRKMLPCMNENVACGCLWIFLSVCVFTLVGLLFIILMIIIAKYRYCCFWWWCWWCCCCCSQEGGLSEEMVAAKHPSDYPGPDDDDHYDKIKIGRHSASQDNTRKPKMNHCASFDRHCSPNIYSRRFAARSSPPPNPHNEVPQHQQPTTAQGPVYSDLPVTNHSDHPQQYIAGNMDNNYSELKKT